MFCTGAAPALPGNQREVFQSVQAVFEADLHEFVPVFTRCDANQAAFAVDFDAAIAHEQHHAGKIAREEYVCAAAEQQQGQVAGVGDFYCLFKIFASVDFSQAIGARLDAKRIVWLQFRVICEFHAMAKRFCDFASLRAE